MTRTRGAVESRRWLDDRKFTPSAKRPRGAVDTGVGHRGSSREFPRCESPTVLDRARARVRSNLSRSTPVVRAWLVAQTGPSEQ
jgi:hypothetical protein